MTLYPFRKLRLEMRRIDGMLTRPVEAFLIGGCAMSYARLKDETKDIDLVLRDRAAFSILEGGLLRAGYHPPAVVEDSHRKLEASGFFEQEDHPRWDVFIGKVCGQLQLSPGMIARATRVESANRNLRLWRIAMADVFVFKSITERVRDQDDRERIVRAGIDWQSILDEMRWQSAHAEVVWTVAFIESLEVLEAKKYKVPILADLREVADREVGNARVLQLVEDGIVTESALVQRIGEDRTWVLSIIRGLLADGKLVRLRGRLRRSSPSRPRKSAGGEGRIPGARSTRPKSSTGPSSGGRKSRRS